MALFAYVKQTQRLLRDQKQDLFVPDDLVVFVNTARGQVAGEGECVRAIGTVPTVSSTRLYNFSNISFASSGVAGVQGTINVRSIVFASGTGFKWLNPRNWEWFLLYALNNAAPVNGAPKIWSQFGQGASGSFYLDPPPDAVYALNCDCACYPVPLVDDTTVEALPYLWTDAVPFYAAYYALMTLQRMEEAEKMFATYRAFMDRARQMANPSVSRALYTQALDLPALTAMGGARGAQ